MKMDSAQASIITQAAIVLAVTMVTVKVVQWCLRYRAFFKHFNSIQGETSFNWIWGNMHKFRGEDQEERIQRGFELMRRSPKFYRLWAGPFLPIIEVFHPDSVRELLKTSEPKPMFYNFALPWLGTGLLLANGQRWARSRRLLTSAFHFDILKPYVAISNSACQQLMKTISKHAAEESSFEVFSLVSLFTLDVVLQCAMSFTNDVQSKGENHPYIQAVNELSSLWFDRGRNPFLYPNFIYKLTAKGQRFGKLCRYVHSVSESIIHSRQQTLNEEGPSKKRCLDFLDILLTARDDRGQGLSPLEIRHEVDTFLFEGHDTTASAISWILYSLAQHPLYQQQVQTEIDGILQGRDTEETEWADLPKLEYLTQVIKEGMRLHCPVPYIQRQLTQSVTLEGVELPAGTFIAINLLNLHHNPWVWQDASTFDPGRFHPDKVKDINSYAFVPFSAGPRNCIGQHFAMNEIKVVLCRLLYRFTFTLDEDHEVTKEIAAVMRARNGIKLFATSRQPSSC